MTKKNGRIEVAQIAAVFDQLKPISPEFLIGKWKGFSFDTGHPAHRILDTLKWAGKDYRSVDDVDPIMIYDDSGKRSWYSEYGHARVSSELQGIPVQGYAADRSQIREVKFHGTVSAAMIYDKFPIIDVFKYVDDNTVLGAMDSKDFPADAGEYYFYLKRFE